jgi:hypothetical protein
MRLQEYGDGALSELLGIARFKIHEGKIDEYKRLSAQAMELVRTKIRRPRSSTPPTSARCRRRFLRSSVLHGEVLGEPSEELRANLANSEVPELFTPYESM